MFYLAFALCKFLQTTTLDLADAMQYVETFTGKIQNMRDNSESAFDELFKEAVDIAAVMDMNISMPRITGKQTSRPNYNTSDPKEYFRVSLFFPFSDFLLQEMNDRFLTHKSVLESLCCLIPNKCAELDDDSIQLCCEVISKQYGLVFLVILSSLKVR